MALRFHLDEHIPPLVATGLRGRGVDVTIAIDVGLAGSSDRAQLDYASGENRILVTCDSDFLILHKQSDDHTGIAFWTGRNNDIGGLIRWLALLSEVYEQGEMRGRVEFIP